MKNHYIAIATSVLKNHCIAIVVSILCLIGICICHGNTDDVGVQLAIRCMIDGILVVLWIITARRFGEFHFLRLLLCRVRPIFEIKMKNRFIAVSIVCLTGILISHGMTGNVGLQLAKRYIIDGILVVLWFKMALRYRLLVVKENALKRAVGPIQEKEDALCREIDSLLSSVYGVIEKNPEVFGR